MHVAPKESLLHPHRGAPHAVAYTMTPIPVDLKLSCKTAGTLHQPMLVCVESHESFAGNRPTTAPTQTQQPQMPLQPKTHEHGISFALLDALRSRCFAAPGTLWPPASVLQGREALNSIYAKQLKPLDFIVPWYGPAIRRLSQTRAQKALVEALHALLLVCMPKGHCCCEGLQAELTCPRLSRSAWRRSASSTLSLAVSILEGSSSCISRACSSRGGPAREPGCTRVWVWEEGVLLPQPLASTLD